MQNIVSNSAKSANQPTIRPRQRTPYVKGTHQQIDERRGCVARLLARGARKMEIHCFIKKKFSRQWRTVDRDIGLLRKA